MLESPLHEHHLLRYEVLTGEGTSPDKPPYVSVNFFNDNHKRVFSQRFPVITKEEIFRKIDQGESIDISGHYISDLSLSEYRSSRKLDEHAYVRLVDFKAERTFFDCDLCTDLSYALFDGVHTIFESAIFGNGSTNFYYADFGHGDVSFRKAKFGSG